MKVKSFVKFLLDHFSEDDDIEVSHALEGGCLLMKLENGEADDSLIWIADGDNETYYHGELVERQYELENTAKQYKDTKAGNHTTKLEDET